MAKAKKETSTVAPTTLVNARENDYTIGIFYGSGSPLTPDGFERNNINAFQERILDQIGFEKGFAEWFCSLLGEVLGCRCDHGPSACHGAWLIKQIEITRGKDPQIIRAICRKSSHRDGQPTYISARRAWGQPQAASSPDLEALLSSV